MVKTVQELKFELRKYNDPVNKIHRLIKERKLFQLTKGLYETDEHAHPFSLAQSICNPSYISFESALSYYGLIPERVNVITSASLGKRKDKIYHNDFGTFSYTDIPVRAYPYGGRLVELSKNEYFQIATKEKALCDKLYKLPPINNYQELKSILFDDLRIYEEGLYEFNLDDMELYSDAFHSKNVTILYKFLRRILK